MEKRRGGELAATVYRGEEQPRRAVDAHHPFVLDVLLRCYWSRTRRYLLEEVELVVDLLRPLPGALQLSIYDTAHHEEPIEVLQADIAGNQVRVPWTVLQDDVPDEDELPIEGGAIAIAHNEPSRLYFEARLAQPEAAEQHPPHAQSIGVSSGRGDDELLLVIDKLHVQVLDDEGAPLGGCEATVTLPDGETRVVSVGGDGMLLIEQIAGGSCHIDTGLTGKAPLDVLTVDHAGDPPQRVRVPAALQAPLSPPDDAFDEPEEDDGADPFTAPPIVTEVPASEPPHDGPSEPPPSEPPYDEPKTPSSVDKPHAEPPHPHEAS